jgi:hypothetical protein
MSAFACELRFVEDVDMYIPDLSALQHIARLPKLRSLATDDLHLLPSVSLPPPGVILFPQLEKLWFGALNIEAVDTLLRMCTNSPMQSLSVWLPKLPNSEVTEVVYHKLRTCTRWHGSLRSIILLNGADIDFPPHNGYMISSRAIEQLFPFGNVTEVRLLSPFGFDLDDTIVARMARAWPHIETLELKEHLAPARQPLTGDCLRSFARYCPHLQRLHLTFDASIISRRNAAVAPVPQRTLRILEVAHSRISSPTAVVGLLVSIFPNLDCVDTNCYHKEYPSDEDEWGMQWGGWDDVMHALQRLRSTAYEASQKVFPRLPV